MSVNEKGELSSAEPEPTENVVTWVYEEGSFVPSAKLVGKEKYSIISNYLGTPELAYDSQGNKVWEREIDIYGKVQKGDSIFVPFLYQGQYFDNETELAYNRFRYYSPETGTYISQDPIGLNSRIYNFYSYVSNVNSIIDPFGLDYIYELVDSSGNTYYTGKAADNASMQSVAERHSKTEGSKDGARFGKGDKMRRKTDTGLDKNTTRGLEQRGIDERPLLVRQNENVRGNKINSTNPDRDIFDTRSKAADKFLKGKKITELPTLDELTYDDFKAKKHH